MTGTETDEALMARVAARDQRAFRVLMERHMARLIAVAERIGGSNADADDIGQEAFFKVWEKAATFNPAVGRFTTWAYRIVVNLTLDRRRRPGHRLTRDLDAAADVAAPEPDALADLLAGEQARIIDRALAELPDRQKAAIALFHMEGLSCREAASILNVSEKAFESLLNRGRRALKLQVAVEEKD